MPMNNDIMSILGGSILGPLMGGGLTADQGFRGLDGNMPNLPPELLRLFMIGLGPGMAAGQFGGLGGNSSPLNYLLGGGAGGAATGFTPRR